MKWFEKMPDYCPPDDVNSPDNGEFYRLCTNNPATSSDFLCSKSEQPERNFGDIPKCILYAVSIWDDIKKCKKMKKFKHLKNKKLAKIKLNNNDGVIKNYINPNHYSWWRSDSFDPSKTVMLEK